MNGKKAKLLRRVLAARRAGKPLDPRDVAAIEAAAAFRTFHAARLAPKPVRERKRPKQRVPSAAELRRAAQRALRTHPQIVLHPLRQLRQAMLASNPTDENGVRTLRQDQRDELALLVNQPKHAIDAAALRAA